MNFEEFRTKLFGMSGLATVENAFELYSELEAENNALRKDNAKLECLALLYKREMYRFKTHFHTLEHTNRKRDFFSLLWKHTNKAYRKAKKDLREGK